MFDDLFGRSLGGLDNVLNDIVGGVSGRAQLARWFSTSAGQHEPSCGKNQKGDLVRMRGNCGLPTVRADLAGKLDKISVSGDKKLVAFVWEKLTPTQKKDLERFAPK